MSNSPALVARGLSVRFGRVEALSDVDLEIPSGASVAVLGPNGAGKSTLFAAALGIAEPSKGSIELGTSRVAFVPQRIDIEPAFPVTVTDVVRMGRYGDVGWLGRFSRRDHELVAEAIERLRIGPLAGRRFGDLSGGERQRALLAQAAAQDAQLLLLDEPFTGVDAPTREALRNLLDGWTAEGRTVLVATHDLQSASRDYESVICLNRRLVAFGPAAEVCTESVLSETFAGHTIRVGETLIDTAHHHHGAG
ncbi:MAG: metal ABC transporter ATP-binding protein [Solirubrobacterales bacterium]